MQAILIRFFPMITVAIISGCTNLTVGELRGEPPSRTASFPMDYYELANCTAEKLQGSASENWSIAPSDLSYEIIHRPSRKLATVTGKYSDLLIPLVDITFSRESENASFVEIRHGGLKDGPRRGGEKIEESAWTMIKSCAADN